MSLPERLGRMAAPIIVYLAVLYFLLFAALGAEVPFIPQVLAASGLPAGSIGLILAAGTIAQVLVAPVFGRIADHLGARLVMLLAAIAAAASILLLLVASVGFWPAIVFYILFAIATAPLNPLADAMAVPTCVETGFPYGRVRGVGSAGFFVGILLSSTIATRHGTNSVIFTSAILFVTISAVLPLLRPMAQRPKVNDRKGGIGELLGIRAFRRVLFVAVLVIGSHAMSDAFAVIHWQAIGLPSDTIGVMLAVAVVSEFLVFVFFGPVLLRAIGPPACAALGAIVGAARWAVLAESPSVWPVLATQLLHGLTFSLVHLACMEVLASVAPQRAFATAQSLYSISSNAIASACITLAAGVLFGTLHAHAFWLASMLCLLAFPVALRLKHA